MKNRCRFMFLFALLTMLLVACGTAEPVEVTVEVPVEVTVEVPVEVTVEVEKEVEVEKQVEVTVEVEKEVEVTVEVEKEVIVEVVATPEPVMAEPSDRNGAWIDTVIVVEEADANKGVSRLESGDIDIYAYTISDPELYDKIVANENFDTSLSYGSYNEISFNNSSCADEAALNPFSTPAIREAMNYMVDRDFMISEFLGGLGVPKFVAINAASADRARLAAEIRAIESQYAYNPETGAEIIASEMEDLGAEMVDGVWTFEGEPVELTGLIRTEDERLQIGDYVSNVLEDLGFAVVRDYKTSAEASPVWLRGVQEECNFHFYTGGWISSAIDRDAGGNFNFFYTPKGLPFPMWEAYNPTEELDGLAQRLNDNDFKTLDERRELFAEILPLTMEASNRIFLYDATSITPWNSDFDVASDLSGSVYGTFLWPYTLRPDGDEGGSVTWAMPSILTEAWNPIGGSNWIYDQTLIRATGEQATMSDPYTGLQLPHRIESATVTVQEDLPVGKTLDWLELETEAEITVPDDAWVRWDATEQAFIEASDFYTETETALLKSTVVYPADMFDTVKWHDGSPLSIADFVMGMIMAFDQAQEDSPYYDAAQVPNHESFLSTFKGMRVVSTDPLTIEHYTDGWTLDAENGVNSWWPYYRQGQGSWHMLAIGLRVEEEGGAAFSASKATENEVEHLSYLSGPTVELLNSSLMSATEEAFIPFANTLGQFVTEDEAVERYTNYADFFGSRGHFWIGTGPFYMQGAFPVAGQAILQRNLDYPDPANKWDGFSAAPIPSASVDGDGRVSMGDEVTFDVAINLGDEAYPEADIDNVTYLLFNAVGELADSGSAESAGDGIWAITLSEDVTSELEAGSNRLEVVVVSKLVALPATADIEFVTTP